MKIFNFEQLKQGDLITLKNQNISFLDLMERVGGQLFNLIHSRLQGSDVPIKVFCGLGNNGGDGLVVSRLLLENGYNVTTYIVNFSDKRSEGFLKNYDRLKSISKEWPIQLKDDSDFPKIGDQEIIIDAIFGVGLNKPIVDWVLKLMKHLNSSRAFTLSIDIPSGLYLDQLPKDLEGVIYANSCVTLQSPKLVFYLPQTAKYIQDLEIIDIGVDRTYLTKAPAQAEFVVKNTVLGMYKSRNKFDQKWDYGHALLIGGSKGKMGSVSLASEACLRIGAGLVTTKVPTVGLQILQSTLPEVMVEADESVEVISSFKTNLNPTTIGVGVGLGTDYTTVEAFKEFLNTNKLPLVIDADAINILAQNPDLLSKIPATSILTPHSKELERLIGAWEDDFEKLTKTQEFSKKHNVIVISKGAHSQIIYKDLMYVNSTGNPGMATAGSGDVLTGMITGLVSQGYNTLEAAIMGVYLHGLAADVAVNGMGYQALIARDIIANIGNAFLELFKQPEQQVQS